MIVDEPGLEITGDDASVVLGDVVIARRTCHETASGVAAEPSSDFDPIGDGNVHLRFGINSQRGTKATVERNIGDKRYIDALRELG